jgi:negative regulator of sigma E activity
LKHHIDLLATFLQFLELIDLLRQDCIVRQRSPSFTRIAGSAGRDEIEDVIPSTCHYWFDVVAMKYDLRSLPAAVLAGK